MLPVIGPTIAPMTVGAIDKVRALESRMAALEQVEIPTAHVFHAGMYSRTIRIPAGVALTGVLITRATLLVISGRVSVYVGDGVIEIAGHQVIPASAGRKQAFIAHEDTDVTMVFPSQASSVEQAEAEFTNEPDLLLSRRQGGDSITVTGA